MSEETIEYNVDEEIEKNHQLLVKIDKLLKNFEILSDDKRNHLFVGYYKTALSHFYAIEILTKNKVYNSSFSLMRSLFESLVRGVYLRDCLAVDKIDKLYDGDDNKIFPNMTTMVTKIDELHDLDYFTSRKNAAWGMMNDYTHTGANQISRNFNDDTGEIAPNFSDEEVSASLTICNELITTFTNLFCGTFAQNEDYNICEKDCQAIFGERTN